MTALRVLAAPAVGIALFVTGCASERHHEIPPSARLSVEGDRDLTYSAPKDGRVYIYDVNEDRMVYQGIVEKGDVIDVNHDDDRVSIDGRTVAEKDAFDVGHQHRIFFMEEERAERLSVPAGSRIEVQQEPSPQTEIRIQEDQPDTRIEVQEQPDPDTRIEVQPGDSGSDTRINVDRENEGTEIKVD